MLVKARNAPQIHQPQIEEICLAITLDGAVPAKPMPPIQIANLLLQRRRRIFDN